jgi:hypothetical protein
MGTIACNALNISEQGMVYFDGVSVFSGVDGGTAGNVLTSNGTGSPPSFQAASGGISSVNATTCGSSVAFIPATGNALLQVTDASLNTIIGESSGGSTTIGTTNQSFGAFNMNDPAFTGTQNSICGSFCMQVSGSASGNSIVGNASGQTLTTGANSNTILGSSVFATLTTGHSNVGVGNSSGGNYTSSESNNLLINNAGVLGDQGVTRIGNSNQTSCFVSGISNVTLSNPSAQTVVVDPSTGQLGSTTGSNSLKVTTYNVSDSPATWTKDSRTKIIEIFGWAGGGGGGSGRKGTTALSGGGGGGSAGGGIYYKGLASAFGNTETVIIGAGGAGGTAQSTDANNGVVGVVGGNTSFGNIKCLGGNFGAAGTTGTAVGGNGVAYIQCFSGSTNGAAGGNGTETTSSTNAANTTATIPFLGTSGGGGGGCDSVTQRVGGNGSNRVDISLATILAGGLGGLESTGIAGTNGNTPPTSGGTMCGGSGGGGGGGYSIGAGDATTGGNGGNGAIPGGGGGGGGGGLTAVAISGAGGNGANGQVIVIEYF